MTAWPIVCYSLHHTCTLWIFGLASCLVSGYHKTLIIYQKDKVVLSLWCYTWSFCLQWSISDYNRPNAKTVITQGINRFLHLQSHLLKDINPPLLIPFKIVSLLCYKKKNFFFAHEWLYLMGYKLNNTLNVVETNGAAFVWSALTACMIMSGQAYWPWNLEASLQWSEWATWGLAAVRKQQVCL